jgi:YHS domain-containing protein
MTKKPSTYLLVFALGLIGCGGDDGGAPAGANQPPAAGKPAVSPATGSPTAAPGSAKDTAKDKDNKTSEAPPLEPPKTSSAADAVKPVKLTDAQRAKIKTLPADEQEAALKQGVCPVSGGNLGSMGTPFKITKEGRTFYLCCDGCEDEVNKDPKAVIAKLDGK